MMSSNIQKSSVRISTPVKKFGKEVSSEPRLFNGFRFDHVDFKVGLPEDITKKLVSHKVSYVELVFNMPDKKLYSVIHYNFNDTVSDKQIKTLENHTKKILKEFDNQTIKIGKTENVLTLIGTKPRMYSVQLPTVAPKGFLFIEELFSEPKDEIAYHEFLNDEHSFSRLKDLCKKKNLEIPEEAITGIMLPIHQKDPSGFVFILEEVKHYFAMFKLSKNYLRGFEEGSIEHSIGTLMTLDIKYNDYMLGVAERATNEEKGPNLDNFDEQYDKAVLRVKKNPSYKKYFA